MNSTQEHILLNIKLKGPQIVSELAESAGISKEGMRQQLEKLEKEGYILFKSVAKGVGRPTILYDLDKKGLARFPDSHAGLTVQLLESIREVLGQDAIDQVVAYKQQNDLTKYTNALEGQDTITGKLENLTDIRSKEGYMAEWSEHENGYLFIENNCPICTAATKCEGFCNAELENIQKLLGDKIQVERIDHTVKGDRRCSYSIKEK